MGRLRDRIHAKKQAQPELVFQDSTTLVLGVLFICPVLIVAAVQWRQAAWSAHAGSLLGNDWVSCVASLSTEQAYYDLKSEPHVLIRTTTQPPFWLSLLPNSLMDFGGRGMLSNGSWSDDNFASIVGEHMDNWKGRSVVDVGSAAGWLSAFAAVQGHKTYIFEEDTHSIVKLCQTQSANQFGSSQEIINQGVASWNNGQSQKMTTLDHFFDRRGCSEMISLLNVADVKGQPAVAVMEGAWNFLKQCDVKAVHIDLSQSSMPASFERVCNKMLKTGYRVYGISGYLSPTTIRQSAGLSGELDGKELAQYCGNKCSILWVKEGVINKESFSSSS